LYEDIIHDDDESFAQSLYNLRGAHELAGCVLCNSGCNNLLLFHFGMAWRVSCHGLLAGDKDEEGEWKWRSTVDYAQMCKLSGFPKLGMLALLFYCTGGCPHDSAI
jgi:hypothetical protein